GVGARRCGLCVAGRVECDRVEAVAAVAGGRRVVEAAAGAGGGVGGDLRVAAGGRRLGPQLYLVQAGTRVRGAVGNGDRGRGAVGRRAGARARHGCVEQGGGVGARRGRLVVAGLVERTRVEGVAAVAAGGGVAEAAARAG